MQIITLVPTATTRAQVGFATIEKNYDRVTVKFDSGTKVVFEVYKNTFKVRSVMINWSTTWIYDYSDTVLNNDQLTLLTSAAMALGISHLYLNRKTGLYLDNSGGDTPVHRPQEALCGLKGARTISQHRKEPVRHTNNNDSTVELLGAVLGLGLALMRRR